MIWPTFAHAERLLPIVESGFEFMGGDTGKSLTGANSYFLGFRAEEDRGFFRTSIGFEIPFSSGTTTIGSSTPAYSIWGARFSPGFALFPFKEGHLMPFLAGSGILAWHQLQLTNPPAGTEPNTQALAYGYEIAAGIDVRFGSKEGRAFRLRGSLINLSTTLGGVSGFKLQGVQFSLGYVF